MLFPALFVRALYRPFHPCSFPPFSSMLFINTPLQLARCTTALSATAASFVTPSAAACTPWTCSTRQSVFSRPFLRAHFPAVFCRCHFFKVDIIIVIIFSALVFFIINFISLLLGV
jgi:hypothetical protein